MTFIEFNEKLKLADLLAPIEKQPDQHAISTGKIKKDIKRMVKKGVIILVWKFVI